jgi:hypothetical protein
MLFSLEVLRARKGDCLLLHYGGKNDQRLIMIDGGPSKVYSPHLKPRIQAIRAARGLSKNEPLAVDLLMVSHVDDDHIHGILDLTGELRQAKAEQKPQSIQVLNFWHNSFDEIMGTVPAELTASFKSQFGTASTSGELPDDATVDSDEDEEVVVWSLKALASIEQGAQLRHDTDMLEFPRNVEFDGGLILATDSGGEPFEIGPGLTFTVAGPMKPELLELHKKHQEWLADLKAKGQTPEDVLSAYVDKSVPNLSSIVVLAEAEGKRILLTGDARGDKILEGLELVGLVEPGGTIEVDVLKVPHHGSSNNVGPDFFERIIAKHYVFSGNGEHGNPERETLEMLLKARGEAADYTIHLTYPVEEVDAGRKKDWEKERNKQLKKREKNPNAKVREEWSQEEHSLQALFDANPDFGAKVSVIEGDEPHVIDLLEKVDDGGSD